MIEAGPRRNLVAEQRDSLRRNRYLITGGSGFLSRKLAERIVGAGGLVRVASRQRPADLDVEWRPWDLDDSDGDWPDTVSGCVGIFHLAWSTIPKTAENQPAGDASTNIGGTVRLLEAARTHPGIRFVFVSSGGTVYGNPAVLPVREDTPLAPVSAYGVSKACAEEYCRYFQRRFGLDVWILRLGNPFGPGQSMTTPVGAIAAFAGRALRGERIEIWGDGSATRDYVYIDDVIDALMAAMVAPARVADAAFNIGSGIGFSINEILLSIQTQLGRGIDVSYSPGREFDVKEIVLDISKAAKILNWRPKVSLSDGIARSLAHWASQDRPEEIGTSKGEGWNRGAI